jgi:hypothetical protein
MSVATATTLAVAHLSAQMPNSAGGVGDGVATAAAGGVSGYPFHVVYNVSMMRNDPGLIDDDGMFEVVLQVTTAATTRALRDLAGAEVEQAMIVTAVGTAAIAGGGTLTVIGRTFDSRSADSQKEGAVYSLAQRFIWLCTAQ